MAGTGLGQLCAPDNCAGRRACLEEAPAAPSSATPNLALEGLTQPCLMSRGDEWGEGRELRREGPHWLSGPEIKKST